MLAAIFVKSPFSHSALFGFTGCAPAFDSTCMVPSLVCTPRASGPLREDIHSDDCELARDAPLPGPAERIDLPHELPSHEPHLPQQLHELSRRESAGDSTSPQIDVL